MGLNFRIACMAAALLLSGCQQDQSDNRPNILLIVADDLGYTDLGIFGSEIPTPNLDTLASQGMLLTSFYAAPNCSPTRAMLFSGTDNHLAGLGSMAEAMQGQPERIGQPGWEGYLNFQVASLGDLMTDAGYNTYMAGKWHLGLTEDTSPAARGMKRSFALLQGGAAHLSGISLAGNPDLARYRMGYDELTVDENFYSTRDYTQYMKDFIESDREQDKPFFAYLAYTAPHWPLQAPDESIARFAGWYDEGYEALYKSRLARMAQLGLLPQGTTEFASSAFQPAWDSLSEEEKRFESRRMEIYAAMVSDLDHYVGELIAYLKDIGEYDNTLIFFMSDNGAEGGAPVPPAWINSCCDNSYDNLGKGNSYIFHGPNWARAVGGPFRDNKATTFEGGIRVPAFVHFPAKIAAEQVNSGVASVTDLLPTFLELAGSAPPGPNYKGRTIHPPVGKSLLPVFHQQSESVHSGDYIARELFRRRSLRKDDWKIVMSPRPGIDTPWELYNLAEDASEARDVSASFPEKVDELARLWDEYAAEVGLTRQ